MIYRQNGLQTKYHGDNLFTGHCRGPYPGRKGRRVMDIILILFGAIVAMVGFLVMEGDEGIGIGIIGFGAFLYGLIINHRRHQGR